MIKKCRSLSGERKFVGNDKKCGLSFSTLMELKISSTVTFSLFQVKY